MICRRCGVDIADGPDFCPHCGVSLKTHITLRNYNYSKAGAKKMPLSQRMSLIAMAVCIVGIAIMIGLSKGEQEKKDFQAILDAFETKNETVLMLTVGQFKKNHPNSPLLVDAERYLDTLRGVEETPIDAEPVDPVEQTRLSEIQRLTPIARDSILEISTVSLSDPNFESARNVTILWRNKSKRTVEEIQFKIVAYDANGKEVPCTKRNTASATLRDKGNFTPNSSGDPHKSIWLKVWYTDRLHHITLQQVKIVYADNSIEILPPEIVQLVLDKSPDD